MGSRLTDRLRCTERACILLGSEWVSGSRMPADTQFEQEKQELEALIASGVLARAPSLEQLLTYVCAKYFEGEAEQIKEYNIAVEALGRSPEFDQKRDSIVRVEAHRLRKRLREYYDREGASHPVHIVIPQGHYTPRFVVRQQLSRTAGEDGTQAVSLSHQDLETVEAPPGVFVVRSGARRVTTWLLVAALLAVLAAVALMVSLRKPPIPGIVAARAAVDTGPEIRFVAGSSV